MKKTELVIMIVFFAVIALWAKTTGDSFPDEEVRTFLIGLLVTSAIGAIMGTIIGAIRTGIKKDKDMLFMQSSVVAGICSCALGFIFAFATAQFSKEVSPNADENIVLFFCLAAFGCVVIINTTYDLVKGKDSNYYKFMEMLSKI